MGLVGILVLQRVSGAAECFQISVYSDFWCVSLVCFICEFCYVLLMFGMFLVLFGVFVLLSLVFFWVCLSLCKLICVFVFSFSCFVCM